jgi:uncharacterized glyoxalase superfamily protein PhnB
LRAAHDKAEIPDRLVSPTRQEDDDERHERRRGQGVRSGARLRAIEAIHADLGFTIAWSTDDLAYVRHGNASFLLQNFYVAEHAGNFMMHLQVEDVDAWWRHVERQGLASKYVVTAEPPADRSWGMRDFVLVDPTGVLWRIAQNIPAGTATDG